MLKLLGLEKNRYLEVPKPQNAEKNRYFYLDRESNLEFNAPRPEGNTKTLGGKPLEKLVSIGTLSGRERPKAKD
jgi:hypothetical protein